MTQPVRRINLTVDVEMAEFLSHVAQENHEPVASVARRLLVAARYAMQMSEFEARLRVLERKCECSPYE